MQSFKFSPNDRLVHRTYGFNRCAKVLSRNYDLDHQKQMYVLQVYDRAGNTVRTYVHEKDVVETVYEPEMTH